MKTTRKVIVIETTNETIDGKFAFATDFAQTLDFSYDIKHADEFDSIEAANERIKSLNDISLVIKKYSYEVDVKFLHDAEHVEEIQD